MQITLFSTILSLHVSMSYAGNIPRFQKGSFLINKYSESSKPFPLSTSSTLPQHNEIIDQHHDNPKLRILANFLGYAGAAGSCYLYFPIIMHVIETQTSRGLSITSWLFNAVGLTAAIVYPFKKRFPLSTYLDAVVLLAQVGLILFLMAYFENSMKYFGIGFGAYSVASGLLLSSKFPEKYLGSIQVVAASCCCYALVPQIYMNFQQQRVEFSPVTASFGAIGNAVRLFNVYQLTKDPLVMTGSGIATLANIIILVQYYWYMKSGLGSS
jgi:mannose-P-dolichol utilization defect 1